jgi:hypothetical protein
MEETVRSEILGLMVTASHFARRARIGKFLSSRNARGRVVE